MIVSSRRESASGPKQRNPEKAAAGNYRKNSRRGQSRKSSPRELPSEDKKAHKKEGPKKAHGFSPIAVPTGPVASTPAPLFPRVEGGGSAPAIGIEEIGADLRRATIGALEGAKSLYQDIRAVFEGDSSSAKRPPITSLANQNHEPSDEEPISEDASSLSEKLITAEDEGLLRPLLRMRSRQGSLGKRDVLMELFFGNKPSAEPADAEEGPVESSETQGGLDRTIDRSIVFLTNNILSRKYPQGAPGLSETSRLIEERNRDLELNGQEDSLSVSSHLRDWAIYNGLQEYFWKQREEVTNQLEQIEKRREDQAAPIDGVIQSLSELVMVERALQRHLESMSIPPYRGYFNQDIGENIAALTNEAGRIFRRAFDGFLEEAFRHAGRENENGTARPTRARINSAIDKLIDIFLQRGSAKVPEAGLAASTLLSLGSGLREGLLQEKELLVGEGPSSDFNVFDNQSLAELMRNEPLKVALQVITNQRGHG
jgi:hypothetical protein